MKYKLTFAITVFLSVAIALTVFAQGKKDNNGNNRKEQHQGKGNGNDKGNKGKGNGNNDNNPGKDNKDKHDNDGNNGKGNGKDNGKGHGDNDDNSQGNSDSKGKGKMKDGFKWDNTNFNDRKEVRKGINKVTICHKFNRGDDPAVTIRVSENALKAHLNHGDITGDCPAVTNKRFSNVFLDRRTGYYQVLQDGQEQVLYSRSILDYAIERLTGAKTQLVTLQQSNAPAADIDRKRLIVIDLENNVSLLQTLVGVTANIIADKLVN